MSNHVFALRKKIRHWGYDSFAYAVDAKPGVADVRSYRRLFRDVAPDDLLLVHFSMGSEVVDQLVKIQARRALVEAGYEETARVPILLDWEHFAVPLNDAVLARWKGLRSVLLFVGRISPNKRQ